MVKDEEWGMAAKSMTVERWGLTLTEATNMSASCIEYHGICIKFIIGVISQVMSHVKVISDVCGQRSSQVMQLCHAVIVIAVMQCCNLQMCTQRN